MVGNRAFVALGSNIDPAANVRAAVQRLARLAPLVGVSTVYLSPALDRPEQAPYYNCVAELAADAPPLAMRHELRRIEAELGRLRAEDKYAARTIDLDLIVYDGVVLDTPELTLPDPDILTRPFLAVSLLELAPDLVLPGVGLPIGEVAARLSREGMEPLEDYTAVLRKETGLEP